MTFTSPLSAPHAASLVGRGVVAAWGRRRRTLVSFLELWRGPALQKPARRALQLPPVFLAFALFATCVALLAAAGPRLRASHRVNEKPVRVIVDCGITLSARAGDPSRLQLAGEKASRALTSVFSPSSTPVDLVYLPGTGSQRIMLEGLPSALANAPLSAVDTEAVLLQTLHDQLQTADGPLIVISDRRLNIVDPRLIQFSPDREVENVGIKQFTAREHPSPQVMVRLRNDSSRTSVTLTVTSGEQLTRQVLELPARGSEKDYFLDLARFDAVIEASLEGADDQPADDKAWLVREGSFPASKARASLAPEIRRMVEVYARERPPSAAPATVAIVASEADLPIEAPAVLVAPPSGDKASGTVNAVAHPITANVDWLTFPATVLTAGEPPRGWMPLVTVGGHVIVAARAEPVRQVWVGFDASTAWTATPDFVIFWANILGWAGQGKERFVAYSLNEREQGWLPSERFPAAHSSAELWPGVYQSPLGELRTFNAPSPIPQIGQTTPDWRERLALLASSSKNGFNASPWLGVMALVGLVITAATWKRRNLTPLSVARTF